MLRLSGVATLLAVCVVAAISLQAQDNAGKTAANTSSSAKLNRAREI